MSTIGKAPAGYRWICVASFIHWRSKKRIFAHDYGHKAFRFLVKVKR